MIFSFYTVRALFSLPASWNAHSTLYTDCNTGSCNLSEKVIIFSENNYKIDVRLNGNSTSPGSGGGVGSFFTSHRGSGFL